MKYDLVGRNLVIHLPGEVDEHSIQGLAGEVEACLSQYEIERIVLDFSGVSFMDSTGIGVILGRYKQMAARRGSVAIYGAKGRVRQLIHMAGMEKLIQVCGTEADALKQ